MLQPVGAFEVVVVEEVVTVEIEAAVVVTCGAIDTVHPLKQHQLGLLENSDVYEHPPPALQ